jgi:nicotinate phosphoribosyltransferase
MTRIDEPPPVANTRILCQHPFSEQKRAYVTPSLVQSLYNLYWADGEIKQPLPTWEEARTYARQQITSIRKDHLRYLNPTPYKVSVSTELYSFMHELWITNVPIAELE